MGFNAATENYEDLIEAGVIDPTKVVRAMLQNAASVASLMLMTEALVAEGPGAVNAAAAAGRGMGGTGGEDTESHRTGMERREGLVPTDRGWCLDVTCDGICGGSESGRSPRDGVCDVC